MTGLKYYLNIEGLNGGSTDIGYVGWFEIDGYDFNIDNPSVVDTGISGTGKPTFSPLKINLNSATNPDLLEYIATGKTIKAVQLDGVTIGSSPQTVYSLKLGDAVLNKYDDISTTTGDKLSFDYKQVALTTRSQKPDGSIGVPQSYAYDVSKNINTVATAVPTPATPPSSSSGSVSPTKYYLNIDGLNGGSTAIGHVGWFEIDGYDFNIDNPLSVVTNTTGKLIFSPLKINLKGAANPNLLEYIATGKTIKAIQLDGVTVGNSEQTVYSLTLGAASVTNYDDGSTTAGDKLSFDYKQVGVTTRSQKPDGSLDTPQSYAYDVSLAKAINAISAPATPPISPSGSVSPTKYYLNIDGLNGGSTAIGHIGWFEIDGYDFNIDNPSVIGTGKPIFSPLKINLKGAANPELLKYITTGKTIRAIQLDGVTVGNSEQTVYSLRLGAASVSNYEDTSTTAGDKLSFDYKQVGVTTRSQNPNGSLETPQSYAYDVSRLEVIDVIPTPATPPSSPSGSVSPTKYYLNIDGLNGGSTAIGHVGWFEIDGYDLNIDNPLSVVTNTTGKPIFSPLKINLKGAANPELLKYIATGKTIKAIQLDGVIGGESEQTVYSLKLGAASVSNYDDTSTIAGDKLAFNYKQVGVTTKYQKPDGSLDTQSYAYDVSRLEVIDVIATPATPPISPGGSVNPTKYYLNIDGLNGGSTDLGHIGWFEIDGYDFNVDNPSSVISGSGKPIFSPLKINLKGATNPDLLEYIATGKTIKAIQLDGVNSGLTVYSLKLGDALLNNYDDGSTTAGDKLAFNYKQVAVTTTSRKLDGSADIPQSYAFDVSNNTSTVSTAVPTPATPPSNPSANVNPSKYYLYVDGLNGGSTEIGHVGWFEIDGYDFNVDNPSSVVGTGGSGTGKPTFSPLKIDFSNAANPDLVKYIATGKTIKTIQLDDVKAGQTAYSLKLGAVSVTSYDDVSTTGGDKLAFNYKQVAVTTKSPTGSLVAPRSYAFDVSLNETIDSSSLPPIISFFRPNDFNGDQKSDILWRSDVGGIALWQMNGATVTLPSLTSIPSREQSWKVAGIGDFNADTKSDILWRNDSGAINIWTMDGNQVISETSTSTPSLDPSWKTAGVGDFTGDGKTDILWRNNDNRVVLWAMDGANVVSSSLTSTPTLAQSWKAAGTGDFNGDGKSDILWRNDDGSIALWQMNGSNVSSKLTSTPSLDSSWKINGTADFSGDGKTDVLWRKDSGEIVVWTMDGTNVVTSQLTSTPSLDSSWTFNGTSDFNGDGKADILWRKDSGALAVWEMNGSTVVSSTLTSIPADSSSWKIAGVV